MTPFTVAILVGGWCAGWLLGAARQFPGSHGETPTVSLIVPARNEAARLPALFEALDTAGLDVIVADDDSCDATRAVALAAGARVVPVVRPEGWTGKAWACWQGARQARGDVLVFVDADVAPTRSLVDALARDAAATGGLVSVLPWHRTERPYEQLSALPNLVAVMGVGTGPLPRRRGWRRPAAFGMVVAVPRDVYARAGGHAAAAGSVVDDLALASAIDAVGAPVSTWLAGRQATMRMYGEGPRRLVAGWAKNLASGAGRLPVLRTLGIVLWIAALLEACLLFATQAPLPLSAAVYVLFVVQTALLARRIGRFAIGVTLALPLLVAGFVGMFAWSLVATAQRREIAWRGRNVRVGASS